MFAGVNALIQIDPHLLICIDLKLKRGGRIWGISDSNDQNTVGCDKKFPVALEGVRAGGSDLKAQVNGEQTGGDIQMMPEAGSLSGGEVGAVAAV